jgi:glycerophosphoryl diester phosphodiesterase
LLPFAPLESLIAPPPTQARIGFLTAQPYAHRGLHGGGVIENSRAAFERAIAAGSGIELDVQMSGDGEIFVFHDETLDRLTNQNGNVGEMRGSALAQIRLKDSDESIPRLDEILSLIAGRVPVLIEVKSKNRREAPKCLAIRRALEGYAGRFAVMSFNPEIGRWFHEHAPRITRGLVVTEEGKRGILGVCERQIALMRAKPDFLAYDVRDLRKSSFAARQRKRGLPVLTWTVRTPDQEHVASTFADEMIYETAGGRAP